MKLTPEEKRTVALVEKAIGNWFRNVMLFYIVIFVASRVFIGGRTYPENKLVSTMTESDLRDIIRQEIRK
jgi:hypothetical protein